MAELRNMKCMKKIKLTIKIIVMARRTLYLPPDFLRRRFHSILTRRKSIRAKKSSLNFINIWLDKRVFENIQ